MNAGLLFYRARKTAGCQSLLKRAAEFFGVALSEVRVCVRPEDLNGDISSLLHGNAILFLFSAAPECRPECAEPIFRTLHVPLHADGEPKGILNLPGVEKNGYLIESTDQAIVLLPDEPDEAKKMLPCVFARLRIKFGLPGKLPKNARRAPETARAESGS